MATRSGSRRLTVEILGEDKGARDAFADTERAASGFGDHLASLGQVGAVALAGIATAVVGIGAGLVSIGGQFDTAYDKIQVATGATGEQLAGLQDVFRDVVSAVPVDFDTASTAVAGLASTLGLSGDALDNVSETVLNLNRITGGDLNATVDDSAHLFEQWGIGSNYMSSSLDEIFRASQATGVGVGDLEQSLVDNGETLRGVGLDFQESTALLATLGQAGLDAGDVMPGLSRAMATAAQQGRSATDVFRDTFATIAGAPDDIAASQAALDVFGARAGPRLAQMIREGQLSYEDLIGTIQDGDARINDTAASTDDFGEKFQLLKNRVFVALEPIATKLFDALGHGMDVLGPKVQVAIEWLGPRLTAAVTTLQEKAAVIVGWVQANWPQISETISRVMSQVSDVITNVIGYIQGAWDSFGQNILNILTGAWDLIVEVIRAALNVIKGIFDVVMGIVHGDWSQVWGGIKAIVDGVWDAIVGVVRAALRLLHEIVDVALTALSGVFGNIWQGITSTVSGAVESIISFVTSMPSRIGSAAHGMWDGIVSAFRSAINFLIDAWNRVDFGFHYTVPDIWGIPHRGETFGIDDIFPDIPRLAAGGIATDPTLALIGDGRSDEAVIPLPDDWRTGGAGAGGEVHMHFDFRGAVVANDRQLEQMIRGALQRMKTRGDLRAVIGVSA